MTLQIMLWLKAKRELCHGIGPLLLGKYFACKSGAAAERIYRKWSIVIGQADAILVDQLFVSLFSNTS